VKKAIVIPLRENFLQRLAGEIFRDHFSPGDPLALSRVTILIPHRRGAVYLRNYLFQLIGTKVRGPFLPPRIVAIEDFLEEVAVRLEDPPRRPLTPPDQAWVLFEVVRGNSAYGKVATSWDRFFPWGIRLAALLEEMDRELVVPRDIPYPEDVPREGIAFLEGLGGIYSTFDRHLGEHGFTTRGKRERLVAQRIEEAPLAEGPFYLAGFYALTGAEERIFRHLFARGAMIFWHADPGELPPLYGRWKKDWGLEIESCGPDSAGDFPAFRLHFYEAYDLHAELLQAGDILPEKIEGPDRCAFVLPDPSALIPALYALPQGMPVNVSLGYPLDRTALFSLIEGLMRLQEGRDDRGAYYHQDYLTLIRHPYVQRLLTPSGKAGRIILHLLEEKVRNYGKPFQSRGELEGLLSLSKDPERDKNFLAAEGLGIEEAKEFVRELHCHLVGPWEDLNTPLNLASALREVVRFLFSPLLGPQDSLHDQPLENEFIYTLEDRVIPSLEDTLFSGQPMGKRLLFSLLREIVRLARTPFEGHPLVGLQVLGLLETRLLSFEKVVVIDVNEEVVPAHEEVNPLLPEPLKGAIGLAGREREEAIVRYHFERLIGSAGEVHLLWQASALPAASGLEGKRVRSRFIEKLLWQEEKKRAALLGDSVEKAPLHISARCFLKEGGLAKRGNDQARVKQFLGEKSSGGGLSASLMNTYLLCPLKFYYHYLLDLRPTTAVVEDVDSAELGKIVHRTLEDYFALYRGKTYLKAEDNNAERLIAILQGHFRGSAMYRCLAPEKRFFLEHAAAYRLKSYLSQVPEATFIDALEEERCLTIPVGTHRYSFYGKVDRIDRREGYRIILDYKTGRIENFAKSHFEKRLLPFPLPGELDREGLKAVKGVIKDLQLPLYVLLVASGKEGEIARTLTAYVDLARGGEEVYFLPRERLDGLREAYTSWFMESFPALLAYVVDHMIGAPLFYPATEEEACRFCDYETVCRFSLA
jgi:ATP-dependent helicase/nuclease subunit B